MKTKDKRKIGRPREFDTNEVLDAAISVFFRQGYQKTTLDDLTKAMKIERPSLYYAFGNKEKLYLLALKRYREKSQTEITRIFEENVDTKKAIENLLRMMAEYQLKDADCAGCLIVNTTVDCQEQTAAVRDAVKTLHTETEEMLFEIFQNGIKNGDLTSDTDSRSLAQFFNGVIQGMAVLARAQGSRQTLDNIITQSLNVI